MGVKYGKGAETVNSTDRESENKVMDSKAHVLRVKGIPFKVIKNGVSLGTVAGGPESSREGKGGSNNALCTLNVDPAKIRTVRPDSDVTLG